MEVQLPPGVTQDQVKQFMAYLEAKPVSEPRVDKNCLNCYFGPDCTISYNCKNEVAEHRKLPSRWLQKEKR